MSLTMDNITLSERKGAVQMRAEVAKGGKEWAVPVPKKAHEALQVYIEGRSEDSNDALFVGRQGAACQIDNDF